MTWTSRDEIRLTIRLGLTKGFRLVRGMRRTLTVSERNRIAEAVLDQLELANYRVESGPPLEGHGRKLSRVDEDG